MEIFGIPISAFLGQLLLGLVNGSFYAMLSLGLAVIFGLLNVINFAHGALYMMGAFIAWMGLQYFGVSYWIMLIVAPLLVGVFGIIIEKTPQWMTRMQRLFKKYNTGIKLNALEPRFFLQEEELIFCALL
jgi:branched-chain amino acid transport system permease protein